MELSKDRKAGCHAPRNNYSLSSVVEMTDLLLGMGGSCPLMAAFFDAGRLVFFAGGALVSSSDVSASFSLAMCFLLPPTSACFPLLPDATFFFLTPLSLRAFLVGFASDGSAAMRAAKDSRWAVCWRIESFDHMQSPAFKASRSDRISSTVLILEGLMRCRPAGHPLSLTMWQDTML